MAHGHSRNYTTLTDATVAHAVHPVIPVAGTNQGKPVRSETIGM